MAQCWRRLIGACSYREASVPAETTQSGISLAEAAPSTSHPLKGSQSRRFCKRFALSTATYPSHGERGGRAPGKCTAPFHKGSVALCVGARERGRGDGMGGEG
eukprot:1639529-Rhodomonas_salina.3